MRMFFKMLRKFPRRFKELNTRNASDKIEVVRYHPKSFEIRKYNMLDNTEDCSKNTEKRSIDPFFSSLRGHFPCLSEKRCFGHVFSRFLQKSYRSESLSDKTFPSVGCRAKDDHCRGKSSEKRKTERKTTRTCLENIKNRFVNPIVSSLRGRFLCLKGFGGKKFPVSVSLRIAAVLGTFCLTANLHADALLEARRLAQVGNGYFGEKKFDLAAESYQKALTFVKSPQLYYNLGQTYANLSKPGHALACFLKAETLKPRWGLNKKALSELFEEYPGLSKPPFPWYHMIFRVLSKCTWCWSCAAFFWIFVSFMLYHCIVKKNKVFLSFAVLCCGCFVGALTLIFLNKPYVNLCLLPEKTVGHYAPGDKSPMRYDWAAGTCCKIRSEAADFYFVSTLNQEDGWVKKDALIPLN